MCPMQLASLGRRVRGSTWVVKTASPNSKRKPDERILKRSVEESCSWGVPPRIGKISHQVANHSKISHQVASPKGRIERCWRHFTAVGVPPPCRLATSRSDSLAGLAPPPPAHYPSFLNSSADQPKSHPRCRLQFRRPIWTRSVPTARQGD